MRVLAFVHLSQIIANNLKITNNVKNINRKFVDFVTIIRTYTFKMSFDYQTADIFNFEETVYSHHMSPVATKHCLVAGLCMYFFFFNIWKTFSLLIFSFDTDMLTQMKTTVL